MRLRSAIEVFLAVGAVAAPVRAEGGAAGPDLDKARVALEEQRYDDARSMVHDELARPEAARRAPALEITAIAYLLEAKDAEAAPYLKALYDLAPAFRLADPSLPPRVTEPFAREAARPHASSVALAAHPAEAAGEYTLEVSRATAHLAMSCRSGAAPAFGAVSLSAVGPTRYRFRLPTLGAYACFAIATDADGLPDGRLGTPEEPVELRPQPPATKRGLLTQWWFWTVVGAAVAGTAAIVYAETRPNDVATPQADLTVPLGVRFR